MQLEFDYHQSDQDNKWYWAMISDDNIIAQSTDPQEHEVYCILQIKNIVNAIQLSEDIAVTNRLTRKTILI